jgi:hypothetical protein
MTTSVWIYTALWCGLNAGYVGLRLHVTRQNDRHIGARFEGHVLEIIGRQTQDNFPPAQDMMVAIKANHRGLPLRPALTAVVHDG